MRYRWMVALLGMPLFLVVCIKSSFAFSIGISITAFIGLVEMLFCLRSRGIHASPVLAAMGLLGPMWQLVSQPSAPGMVAFPMPVFTFCVIAVLAAFVWEVIVAARTGEIHAGRNLGYGLICCVYVALFGGLTSLRAWKGPLHMHMDSGAALVILTTLCIWATDTVALFVGRSFGKRKLAPSLSPNKTLEGALGGLVAALAAGAVFGYLLAGSPWVGIAISAVAGIFGQVGDLFESALKRELGLKDFGYVFPGHGGVFDRFDSLLFVAPVISLILYLLRLY